MEEQKGYIIPHLGNLEKNFSEASPQEINHDNQNPYQYNTKRASSKTNQIDIDSEGNETFRSPRLMNQGSEAPKVTKCQASDFQASRKDELSHFKRVSLTKNLNSHEQLPHINHMISQQANKHLSSVHEQDPYNHNRSSNKTPVAQTSDLNQDQSPYDPVAMRSINVYHPSSGAQSSG